MKLTKNKIVTLGTLSTLGGCIANLKMKTSNLHNENFATETINSALTSTTTNPEIVGSAIDVTPFVIGFVGFSGLTLVALTSLILAYTKQCKQERLAKERKQKEGMEKTINQ